MMCIFFSSNTIIRYVEKTLSERKRVRFEKHILKCEKCMKKFIELSELLTAPELMEWEEISREEARSILSGIKQDRYNTSKYRKFFAKISRFINKADEYINDVKDSLRLSFAKPEFELELVRCPKRRSEANSNYSEIVKCSERHSETNSSNSEVLTNFKINDFETNIYFEKRGNSSFNCLIKALKNGKPVENIRYEFIHESGRKSSYLTDDQPNVLPGLYFGRYKLFIKQYSKTIGQKKFNLNNELF